MISGKERVKRNNMIKIYLIEIVQKIKKVKLCILMEVCFDREQN